MKKTPRRKVRNCPLPARIGHSTPERLRTQGANARNRTAAKSARCTGGCVMYVRPVPRVTALTRNVSASIAMSLGSRPGTRTARKWATRARARELSDQCMRARAADDQAQLSRQSPTATAAIRAGTALPDGGCGFFEICPCDRHEKQPLGIPSQNRDSPACGSFLLGVLRGSLRYHGVQARCAGQRVCYQAAFFRLLEQAMGALLSHIVWHRKRGVNHKFRKPGHALFALERGLDFTFQRVPR